MKLNDETALALLIDYLDGTLPPEQHAALADYYRRAPGFLESYEIVPAVCAQALRTAVPSDVLEAILPEVRRALLS